MNEQSSQVDHVTETGVPSVDSIMRAIEALEERPLEEHAGVFEAAHAQLRQALDAAAAGSSAAPGDH